MVQRKYVLSCGSERRCRVRAFGVRVELLCEREYVRAGGKTQPADQRRYVSADAASKPALQHALRAERGNSGDLALRATDSKHADRQPAGGDLLGDELAIRVATVDARVLSRYFELDQRHAELQSVRGVHSTGAGRPCGDATNHGCSDFVHDHQRSSELRQSVVELHPAAREFAVAGDLPGRPASVSQSEHWTVRQEFARAQFERPWRGGSVGRMVVRKSAYLHYDGSRSRCGFHRRGDRNRDLRPGTFLEEVA